MPPPWLTLACRGKLENSSSAAAARPITELSTPPAMDGPGENAKGSQGRRPDMNRYLLGAVALAAAVAAGGCASNTKQAAAGGKAPLQPLVTDIAPTPPAPVYAPAPAQPVQPVAFAA